MSDSASLAAEALARMIPARDAAYCTLTTGSTASAAFTRSLAGLSEGLVIDVIQPDGSRDVYCLGAPRPIADGWAYSFPAERLQDDG